MFEKEAEEAGNKKIKENNQFARCARKSYKDGFKDGAEFGYNKANVVMAKQRGEIAAQLTKAKEIIKEMLSILPKENIEGVYEITEEAEEFLNKL